MNCQQGILRYADWAAVLDPHAKAKTLRVLTACKKSQVWCDIQQAALHIAESAHQYDVVDNNNTNNIRQDLCNGAVQQHPEDLPLFFARLKLRMIIALLTIMVVYHWLH
jgi:hypothetical protein